ncbi:polyprotein 1a [Dregea volubilis virus 1]|nr:polyprotein 1a [Dregea volubilis virus 1]
MALNVLQVPTLLVVNIDAPLPDLRVCGGLSGPGAVVLRGSALGRFLAYVSKGKVHVAEYSFAGITVAVLSHREFMTVPSLKYDAICRVFRANKTRAVRRSPKSVNLSELRSIEHPTQLNYTRQFHNKTKTKTKIMSKDGRYSVDFPYGLYSSRAGKPTYGQTTLGVKALSFRSKLSLRVMNKLRVKSPEVFKKGPKRTLKARKVTPPAVRKSKGLPFKPASRDWGVESPDESSETLHDEPRNVTGRESISLNRFLTSKRFTLLPDGGVTTTDTIGARVVLSCPSEKLEELCMQYFMAYTPYSHDFVTGLSLYEDDRNARHYDFELVKSGVHVVDMDSGERVLTFAANAWYRSVHSLKSAKHVPDRLLTHELAEEGYCYLNHVWYLSLLAGVRYNRAKKFFCDRLGAYPRAALLKRLVSEYFGVVAAYIDITGYYIGKDKFHCCNKSRRRYTWNYLRNAVVGGTQSAGLPFIKFGSLVFRAPPFGDISPQRPPANKMQPKFELKVDRANLRRAFVPNHLGQAIPRNRLGWHLHASVGIRELPSMVRDYLRGYNALRDDFVTSLSIDEGALGTSVFQFRLVGRKINVFKSTRNRVVEIITPSDDYLVVYRAALDRMLPSFFYSAVNEGDGLCYLNHLWFLCFITGSSFARASAIFRKALGTYPGAEYLGNIIAQYFGELAATIPVAGFMAEPNLFHCSNREVTVRTLTSLGFRRSRIGGEPGELPASALTGVEKDKLIQKIVDTARGHKDSILVKKVELDLVDYAAKMRDLQKEKKNKKIPFCLTEVQQTIITRDYPEFDLVFTNSRHSDHPMAAASRLLENMYLANLCGDHFSDVGGCPLHHYQHNPEKRVHVCRPVFDSKDAQRRVIRNSQFKQARIGNPTEGMFKVSSNHSSCSKTADECSYQSPYMICVQVYDMDLSELCRAMINKRADVCYLTMITPGEILDRREAFRHDILGCDISLDQHMDSVVYKFGSSCYTHRLSTILGYMTTPVSVIDNYLFSVEMIEVRCGVNIYVITKSEVCPQMKFDKFLRFKRCCSDLVRVKLPKFCKKTRKCLPGVEYIYVDRKFVERVHDYVVGNCSVVNSKTFEWTWNFVKSSRSRVVISGKLIHRDVSISLDHLEQFVVVMLAAGVRTRLTSEYLAKNISIFCGDSGLWDVFKFSMHEKYVDLKRTVSKLLMSSVKKFFADTLLLEFLDLDDCLEEIDDYSEVSIPVKVSSFGVIPDNESEVMIVERSKADMVNSAIYQSAKGVYKPPVARYSEKITEARDAAAHSEGGLMGSSPPGFGKSIPDRTKGGLKGGNAPSLVKNILNLLGISASSITLNAISTLRCLSQMVTGKVGGVLRFISFISFTLHELAYSIGDKSLLELFYRAAVDVGGYLHGKGSTLTGALEMFLVGHVAPKIKTFGDIADTLISVVSHLSTASKRFSTTASSTVLNYIRSLKGWSFIDFDSSLPFEVAVTLIKRFVYDFKAIILGEITFAKFATKFLLNVLYELNLNYLLTLCLGVPTTIKKEFFIRSVSELVASGLLDGLDGSLGGLVRITAFVPILVRKLLVSFFSDDFNEYIPVAKYALSETNSVDYMILCYRNEIQGSVTDLQDRFCSYLNRKLEEIVSSALSAIINGCKESSGYTKLVALTDKGSDVVRKSIVGLRRAFRTSRKTLIASNEPDDSDCEYESASEGPTSALPGLRGGGNYPSVTAKAFAVSRRFFIFLRDVFRWLRIRVGRSSMTPCVLNHLFYGSKMAQIETNLRNTRLVGSEYNESVWMHVFPDLDDLRERILSFATDLNSMLIQITAAVKRRSTTKTFYYYDLPYYIISLIQGLTNPYLAAFNIVSLLLETCFSPGYAGALVVESSAPVPSEVFLTEISGELTATQDEDFYSEFLDDISSSLAMELGDKPGLRGGNAMSFVGVLVKLFTRILKTKSFRWVLKVFLQFFSSSLLSASLTADKAPLLTRVVCFVSSIILRGNLSVHMLRLTSNLNLHSAKLSALIEHVCCLEKVIRVYIQGPVSIDDLKRVKRPEFKRVRVGPKIPLGLPLGEFVDSKEAFEKLEETLNDFAKSDSDSLQSDDESSESSSSDGPSDKPASAPAAEGDRANLVPEMTDEVTFRNQSTTRFTKPSTGLNDDGLCKFLKLQNEISTVPTPYVTVTKGEFVGCTNAMREFYFMQTLNVFSVHSKLQLYFEELERCDFDRRIASCGQDKDLYVYDSRTGKVTGPTGWNFALSKFNDYQMCYCRNGLVLNDPSHKVDKIFHENTRFLASNSLLRACESHASLRFTNINVDIRLYEAPPGGGKTTMLIDLYKKFREHNRVIIVTANKNSQVDILRKLRSSITYGCGYTESKLAKEVLTMDSYLINHFGSKCDILFIDECFMVHAGQVISILNFSACKKCVLFGDSKQIHYIERDELAQTIFHDIDGFIEPECRFHGSVSFRCPWDVCAWLSEQYNHTISTTQTDSVGKVSTQIKCIESIDDVPFASGVKYITYTQAEKNELQRKFSKIRKDVAVNTVHEVQGETFTNVHLVRTKYQEDAPFVSDNHIVVALSRHVKSLSYFVLSSRCYDATATAIKRMEEIAESYKTHPHRYEFSYISLDITNAPTDVSRCKALSAPYDSINGFLNDVVRGSTSVNFGDVSAEMSSMPFESGVDGVTIAESRDEKVMDDHGFQRV